MANDKPRSPEDPAWVDEIVRRSIERAGGATAGLSASSPALDLTGSPDKISSPTSKEEGSLNTDLEGPKSTNTTSDDLLAIRSDTVQGRNRAPNSAFPIIPSPPGAQWSEVNEAALGDQGSQPDQTPDGPAAENEASHRSIKAGQELSSETEGSTDSAKHRLQGFLEWGAVIVGALVVALLIKTFLIQAYYIPSGSMLDTLNVGDRVLVNKLSYNFGDVSRGDLIVFERPPSQKRGQDDLVKRVVALSGERVSIRDDTVFITQAGSDVEQRLDEPYLVDGTTTHSFVNTAGCDEPTLTSCTVPAGHVFVLGDNRDGSKDSRTFGPIDEDLIIGRAFLRIWPLKAVSFL